ncbi:hypothetical protein ES707_22378 [subsurface metagenome]
MPNKYGPWQIVTVAKDGDTSDEANLQGEFKDVQVYNPELDEATITIQPARDSGGDVVPAYTFDVNTTGDFTNTTAPRATAGMNVFKNIYAQYVKVVLSIAQAGGARTFNVRGIDLLGPRS